MRAKLCVTEAQSFGQNQQKLKLVAVPRVEGYSGEGLDEDNTFARFTPSAELVISIQNPALLGKFALGDKFYVDFTKVETPVEQVKKQEEVTKESEHKPVLTSKPDNLLKSSPTPSPVVHPAHSTTTRQLPPPEKVAQAAEQVTAKSAPATTEPKKP
jgi:hypothetical protein